MNTVISNKAIKLFESVKDSSVIFKALGQNEKIIKLKSIKHAKKTSSTVYKSGKRKSTVAKCFITPAAKPGAGVFTINDQFFLNSCHKPQDVRTLLAPFILLGQNILDYDITCSTNGGGYSASLQAIQLGLAKCFADAIMPEARPELKKAGLLTRDSREVESKKCGRHKARKKKQFSKR